MVVETSLLLPSLGCRPLEFRTLTVKSMGWAAERIFQQPTRPADDVKVLTKCLHGLT